MARNVRLFAWLWCISALIAFAELFFVPPPDQTVLKLGVTRPIELAIMAVAMLITTAIVLPFFWLAVWKRKNWARWLLFILFVVSVPVLFLDPLLFRPDHLPLTGTAFASVLFEALAFVFVFTGDAHQWFLTENPN